MSQNERTRMIILIFRCVSGSSNFENIRKLKVRDHRYFWIQWENEHVLPNHKRYDRTYLFVRQKDIHISSAKMSVLFSARPRQGQIWRKKIGLFYIGLVPPSGRSNDSQVSTIEMRFKCLRPRCIHSIFSESRNGYPHSDLVSDTIRLRVPKPISSNPGFYSSVSIMTTRNHSKHVLWFQILPDSTNHSEFKLIDHCK